LVDFSQVRMSHQVGGTQIFLRRIRVEARLTWRGFCAIWSAGIYLRGILNCTEEAEYLKSIRNLETMTRDEAPEPKSVVDLEP
jgi:hypothetical protein